MPELSPNSLVSHYRIVSKLGAGGMGEVYLAQDIKLDRRVALKILPQEFASDADRMRRFVLEAKSASALTHPNIITIYEIGEIGGTNFIATEYLEGETLNSHGLFSLSAALDVAIQIASALQAAHSAGIIHRDIKPQNVMIRPDGLVKVLDFGIAKVSAPVGNQQVATTLAAGTGTGVIVGTASYMSPEQARGKTIDGRSDIFSFGIVLYEMLSLRKPFGGENAMDVIASIVADEPESIKQLVPELPEEIDQIIQKALKKNCEERYQTASELLVSLKSLRNRLEFEAESVHRATASTVIRRQLGAGDPRAFQTQIARDTDRPARTTEGRIQTFADKWMTKQKGWVLAALIVIVLIGGFFGYRYLSPAGGQIDSIAVLPFQNRSSDVDTEYLSDGIAESLIYQLSQLPDLKVSPTSSVFRYKGKDIDTQKIGSELGVTSVLTGRFSQHADNLSISVELVDVRNNKLLWGRQYDRKMSDLLTTQREIASEITQNLKLKLADPEGGRVTRSYTKDPEAYRLYLKGHYHASRYTKEGFNRGIEYFNQAISKDPNFALAHSGLAFCYLNQTDWVFAPKDSVPKARQAAHNALRIDETLPDGHTMLAMVLLQYDRDWLAAEKEFRRAVDLDPDYVLGRTFLAWYLAAMGRFDESIAEDKRALDVDPLSAAANADLGWDLYLARRYNEGIEQLQKAIDLEPNYWVSHVLLGRCYEQIGRFHEAVAEFQKAAQIENSIPEVLAALGRGYALSGRKAEALKIVRQLQERSKNEFVPSFSIATIYIGLGMKEEALLYLERSYEEGSYYMIHLKVDPLLDNLRSEPRFTSLLRRVGHSP